MYSGLFFSTLLGVSCPRTPVEQVPLGPILSGFSVVWEGGRPHVSQ